jgi:hypothetical protein
MRTWFLFVDLFALEFVATRLSLMNEVLPLPKEEVDVTDPLDWMSGFIFGTLRTGFVVTLVFFCGCDGDIVVCCERWLKRKRWQSTENRGKNKVVTE